jgi:PTS system mannose-specific IIA component
LKHDRNLLITHGSYGEALVQNACHVLNKRPVQLNQLGVAAQDDPLDLLPLARQMLAWSTTARAFWC